MITAGAQGMRIIVRALAAKGIFDDADLRQIARDLEVEAETLASDIQGVPTADILNLTLDHPGQMKELAGAVIEVMEAKRDPAPAKPKIVDADYELISPGPASRATVFQIRAGRIVHYFAWGFGWACGGVVLYTAYRLGRWLGYDY